MLIKTIRIIKASGPDRNDLLPERIQELERAGFQILFDDIQTDSNWIWCSGSIAERSNQLNKALLEDSSDAIMWARGGYGASDLLELIPWSVLKNSKPKPIIGFSDACAAQSAIYTKLNRRSIHGPMPATVTWNKSSNTDTLALIELLKGRTGNGTLVLQGGSSQNAIIEGILFGGCLSVLTSLIGTPYLPSNFKDHILFFEDIGENPGRIFRMLNQWQHSGLLKNVTAVILGVFINSDQQTPIPAPDLLSEFQRRFNIPVYSSLDFGHISPNTPILIGSHAKIVHSELNWIIKT